MESSVLTLMSTFVTGEVGASSGRCAVCPWVGHLPTLAAQLPASRTVSCSAQPWLCWWRLITSQPNFLCMSHTAVLQCPHR
jgi:hypothetical protein